MLRKRFARSQRSREVMTMQRDPMQPGSRRTLRWIRFKCPACGHKQLSIRYSGSRKSRVFVCASCGGASRLNWSPKLAIAAGLFVVVIVTLVIVLVDKLLSPTDRFGPLFGSSVLTTLIWVTALGLLVVYLIRPVIFLLFGRWTKLDSS
jgi:uncharacterized protein (DUF983 family)